MTNDHKLAFAYLSMMGTVLNEYEPNELTFKGHTMKRRVIKGLKRLHKHRPKQYVELAERFAPVWDEAVNQFAKTRFEGMSFVVGIATKDVPLMKSFGITETLLEKFSNHQGVPVELEAEQAAYRMADFISDKVLEVLDIEPIERPNLSAIRQRVYNNLVIEGKIK